MTSSTGSQQSYCLRRNNHQSDLVDDLEHMLNDESLVDVTLLCDEGTIRAHKLILSACSSYFRSIFLKLSNPLHYPVIIIKDMPFCDLKAIIEFIYRGEVNVPHEQLPSVLKSAESLKVKGLLDVNTVKSSMCGNGQLNAKKRKKRRRRISRSGSHSNSTDINSEETEEDEDLNNSITEVENHSEIRTYNNRGEIEPSRLLEQSMTTGDDATENGNTVPGYSTSSNMSNVQQITQEMKPLQFENSVGLMQQLPTSISGSLTSNETPLQTSDSQNHISSVPMPSSPFDTPALSSIPGPSTIPQGISRLPIPSQEHFIVGSPHQVSHQNTAHLFTPQMHPSTGCHTLTSVTLETLSSKRHYQCPVCLKSFSEKGNMKRHTQIHLQQRNRYMCDLCSKCFAWKDNFNRHRRVAHCQHDMK